MLLIEFDGFHNYIQIYTEFRLTPAGSYSQLFAATPRVLPCPNVHNAKSVEVKPSTVSTHINMFAYV